MTEPTGRAEDIDDALADDDPEILQDEVSGGMSADERPEAAEGFGTTATETRHGESLAQQLDEEAPDIGQGHDPVDDVVAEHPELDADREPFLDNLSEADIDGGDPAAPPVDDVDEQVQDAETLDEDQAAENAALHTEKG